MVDLKSLVTETRNKLTYCLDEMTPLQIVEIMNKEDERVLEAVKNQLPQIAKVVDIVTSSLQSKGRLIYIGAGTSGRLGVLDAVECVPTFGVAEDKVIGLMAGGTKAFVKAVEGAEDNEDLGRQELSKIELHKRDVVIGLAASGRTPYVVGALEYAKEIGCHTAAIVCNQNSKVGNIADIAIELLVGPEVLTGSTRLKAGSAQKMTCNMITTASMVGCGKVYENLMVDVKQTNEKLVVRAENIVMDATGCSLEEAKSVLEKANGKVKVAIVMLLLSCDENSAQARLEETGGHIRKTLHKGSILVLPIA